MNTTVVNGIVLNDAICKRLSDLQNGQAESLANMLDDSIGFLLEHNGCFSEKTKGFVDVLAILHLARTEFRGLIPEGKEVRDDRR